jgi:hypothetical protein
MPRSTIHWIQPKEIVLRFPRKQKHYTWDDWLVHNGYIITGCWNPYDGQETSLLDLLTRHGNPLKKLFKEDAPSVEITLESFGFTRDPDKITCRLCSARYLKIIHAGQK